MDPLRTRRQRRWLWLHGLRSLAAGAAIAILAFELASVLFHGASTWATTAEDIRMAQSIFLRDCLVQRNSLTQVCRDQAEIARQDFYRTVFKAMAVKLADDLLMVVPFGLLCSTSDKPCLIAIAYEVKKLLTLYDLILWVSFFIFGCIVRQTIRSVFAPAVKATRYLATSTSALTLSRPDFIREVPDAGDYEFETPAARRRGGHGVR